MEHLAIISVAGHKYRHLKQAVKAHLMVHYSEGSLVRRATIATAYNDLALLWHHLVIEALLSRLAI